MFAPPPHPPPPSAFDASGSDYVDGTTVPARGLPWHVSVEFRGGGHGNGCSGTLIAQRWVVTAAHCLSHPNLGPVRNVTVGLDDAGNPDECTKTLGIISTKIHEQYKSTEHFDRWKATFSATTNGDHIKAFDVALLELDEDAQYAPIDLLDAPDSGRAAPGRRLVVAGWGGSDSSGDITERARHAYVPVIANDNCNDATDLSPKPFCFDVIISDDMVCAGGEGAKIFPGDSGGPLYAVDDDGRAALVGVTSFGAPPGGDCFDDPEGRGVYSRVAHVADWICDNTRGAACPPVETTCSCEEAGASSCRVTCTLTNARPALIETYHAIIEYIDCPESDGAVYEGTLANLEQEAGLEGSHTFDPSTATVEVRFTGTACSGATAKYRVSLVSGGLGDVKCNVRRCDYFCGGSLGSSSSVLKKPDYASTTKGQGATRCSTQSKSVTCGAC